MTKTLVVMSAPAAGTETACTSPVVRLVYSTANTDTSQDAHASGRDYGIGIPSQIYKFTTTLILKCTWPFDWLLGSG